MYDSLSAMSVSVLLVGMVLLWVITGKEPWKVLWFTVKDLFANHSFRMTFVLAIAVLMVNKIELSIEQKYLSNVITWDFTAHIHAIEGNVGTIFQSFTRPWLTELFTFLYVFTYPAVIGASLIGYNYLGNSRLVRTMFYAFTLNYLLAVPFYIIFPVKEAWSYNNEIKLLIDAVYPAYHTQYRLVSGLDNCFPSLHTSISVTMALLARISGKRAWSWLASILAAMTMFATLYLGIHWISDMLAGIALAVISVASAKVLVKKDYKLSEFKKNVSNWVKNLPASKF